MKKLKVYQLEPGLKLAMDVVSSDGVVLYPEGNVVTERVISYLKNWNVEDVYVKVEDEEVVKQRRETEIKIKEKYTRSVDKIAKFMESIETGDKVYEKEVKETAKELMDFTEDYYYFFRLLTSLEDEDNQLFQHSINVGIYSSLLAKWLDFDDPVAQEIGLSGLLHDIGRVNKTASDSPEVEDYDMDHPIRGYELIKNKTKFNDSVAKGVLQHHERMNGEGYPEGLKGSSIHFYARIIAVTDEFDQLTYSQLDSEVIGVFKAIDRLDRESFGRLDPLVARTFMNRLMELFIGSTVLLSNEKVGEVIMVNKNEPSRPLVKVQDQFIDLAKNRSITIEKVLEV